MSHVTETEFGKSVLEQLHAVGFETETQVYMPATGRFADVVAVSDLLKLAIEIENDFEAVFKGIGQVGIYAAETGGIPMIAIPGGHAEEPERTLLERRYGVLIREF